jgi:pimeloyl-ACP methyl ester carboxylesterase
MWAPQMDALGKPFRVLRYDTRGHGRSAVPPPPYAIDDLGRDVLALLDSHLFIVISK